MSNFLSSNEVENIKTLGVLSQFRGQDSTGVACVLRSNKGKNAHLKYVIAKATIDSTGFFQTRDVNDLLTSSSKGQITTVIGHCRAATCGDVTKENAHPFQVGPLIGVHNGTISKLSPPVDKQHERTDSLALYELINERGLKAALEEAGIGGAYALVWLDKQNGTLNMYRNNARTLFIGEASSTIYWASEMRMLNFVHASENILKDTPKILQENVLYTWKIGELKSLIKQEIKPTFPVYGAVSFTPRKKPDKRGHAVQVPWEEFEEVVESSEQEQEQTSPPPLQLPYVKKEGSGKRKIDPTKDGRYHDARKAFPNRKKLSDYPLTISVKGDLCHIAFVGYRGTLWEPRHIAEHLDMGCSLTGVIPSISDTVWWIDSTRFVNDRLGSDAFIRNTADDMTRGYLVYVSDKDRHEINSYLYEWDKTVHGLPSMNDMFTSGPRKEESVIH